MAQLGSEEKPFVMSTGTIVSTKSRHKRGVNKSAYDKFFHHQADDGKRLLLSSNQPY